MTRKDIQQNLKEIEITAQKLLNAPQEITYVKKSNIDIAEMTRVKKEEIVSTRSTTHRN